MGKKPCSNCGQTSCNGIDCYYKNYPEPRVEEQLRTQLTSITRERDAAVEKKDYWFDKAKAWGDKLDKAEELLREFIASTDNAETYNAADRVPSCGCCQREEHHPNCPVLRAKAFLNPHSTRRQLG